MAEYQPITTRFVCKGLNVSGPEDALPDGKYPILENVRSVTEGTLEPRAGTVSVASTPGQTDVHTVDRLNDATPFNGGVFAVRVAGAGPTLYAGSPNPGTALSPIDSGFSGDPLQILTAQPVGTPQPWLYIADRARQRKLNVLGQCYDTGIAPPLKAPDARLAAPRVTVIENFEQPAGTVTWLAAGQGAGAPTQITRLNTTITAVLYDEGNTGNATMALGSMINLGKGTLVVVGNTEQTLIQDIKLAIVDTTIEAIIYDNGVGPGLCTIQPLGNLSTALMFVGKTRFAPGNTSFVGPDAERGKVDTDAPSAGIVARRQALVGDGLCRIGSELVRILAVIDEGRDELQCFRCKTLSVHAAGETLVGMSSARVYFQYTHAVGESVVTKGIQNILTPLPVDQQAINTIVGGVRSGVPYFTVLPTEPGGPEGGGTVDYLQTVIDAKNELIAEGQSPFMGPCGSYKIAERTAQKLAGVGCGVLKKTSGNRCPDNDRSGDVVIFANGAVYDILIDSGDINFPDVIPANTPTWRYVGIETDMSRYIPMGNNPIPPSSPPPDAPFATPTELDLSKIGDRMTQPDDEGHISINIDKLEFVKEVRIYFDVDATTNDYTRNAFFYAFGANDLIGAVQAFNAVATVPVVKQLETTGAQTATEPGTQLAVGNKQWIELRWRVKHMFRVGTDPTRSLRHVKGMQILVQALQQVTQHNPATGQSGGVATGPLTIQYDSCWLGGGFGPDTQENLPGYQYVTRYRSKATGATSRPCVLTREVLYPRRQRVILKSLPSPDPQVDTIDYYRMGGNLPVRGAWIGSGPNLATEYFDDYPESSLDAMTPPEYREFQPWPMGDVPRQGRVRVAGSAVEWISGDHFDPRWAPGQYVRINGMGYNLYQQPTSTRMHIVQCAGAFADTSYEVPNPTIMASKAPTLWGPFEGFYFATGDPVNPGLLWWTLGNNPDVTTDGSNLYVTSPSTPLMNGFVWDNAAFVWSTEQLYRILPDFQRPNMFTTNVLPCGRGLWTRWAWCLTPQGPVFLAKDGIYVTSAGSPAASLTDADLYGIFPHDGVPGVAVRGIEPPDMAQTTRLRLAYGDGFLFFDYLTGAGQPKTLVCDLKAVRWFQDQYPVGITTHTAEPGAGVHHVLMGRSNGTIIEYRHRTGDDGVAIPYRIRTRSEDGGEARKEKLIGDLVLDFDPDGGTGVTVTPGLDTFDRTLPPSSAVGAGDVGRDQYILDINSGTGTFAKNIGLELVGTSLAQVPRFYLWETSVIPKAEETSKRATDWEDADYFGAKFVQGVLVEADTEGVPRTVRVEYDGGQLGAIITVNGVAGELQSAHSFGTPFIAHLLRLLPTDDGEWLHYRHRWVWEPSPELAAYWITQPTTHDFPGYGHVERVLIAHMSLVDFDLIVTADGVAQTYRIPASANVFVKTEVLQRPNKGKVYQYAVRSVDGSESIRLFLKDLEVRCKPWGHPDPYQILRPFGDISREFGGARI